MRAPAPALRLSDDLAGLRGVDARRRQALQRLGLTTVEDLLRLAPRRYEDRRRPTPIAELSPGSVALVIGGVARARSLRLRGGLSLHEATVEDGSGKLDVRWYQRGYVPRALPAGAEVALYGVPRASRRGMEMVGPALERLTAAGSASDTGRLVPVHPLSTGLSAAFVRRLVAEALPAAATAQDPLPPSLCEELGLPGLADALQGLHFPEEQGAAERCRRRLAFDELLLHELELARRRAQRRRARAFPVRVTPKLDARIRARLPFALTPGQERAVTGILADLCRPWPMHRLLQGDVGSGKTAVAAYAMLAAVARGLQVAFMAPTEVLARQHLATLHVLLVGSRVRIEALLGGRRGRARTEALARVATGDADVVVGTHAVLSRDVRFQRLGLVVVDEEHKFGVRQRHDLVAKGAAGEAPPGSPGRRPHVLVMTATPIPRTLALTVYGDLDVGVIEGMPPGRMPVHTSVVRVHAAPRGEGGAAGQGGRAALGAVFERVREALGRGQRAFVIYPLVEESDKLGLRDAVAGRERWARALPGRRVALLHGRMHRDEKEAVMEAFRRGEAQVLVATVVVEVGVDVPEATVLVVEHAERFGLSQLHQLRGRVGRGTQGGLCVLVDRSREGAPRLGILARTADGFEIAEEDVRLRGTGDLVGTRQHGAAGFHAASLPRDLALLEAARRVGAGLLERDPRLRRPEHRRLGELLAARGVALS